MKCCLFYDYLNKETLDQFSIGVQLMKSHFEDNSNIYCLNNPKSLIQEPNFIRG